MRKLFIYSAVFVLMNACIPSIHPLYTEEDIFLDDRVLGEWVSSGEENQFWNFKRASEVKSGFFDEVPSEKTARLYYKEEGEEHSFDVRMLELGGNVYFDITPNVFNTKNTLMATSVFPVHTFSKVKISKDEIRIQQFDVDWLRELIDQNKIRIKHERTTKDEIILTASTRSLQKFIEKYGDDPDAYLEPIILRRS